jgi:hypothetical protein
MTSCSKERYAAVLVIKTVLTLSLVKPEHVIAPHERIETISNDKRFIASA